MEVAQKIGLPADLAVVACASGSAALHSLVGVHNHLHGRPLRWVTSSFSFCCCNQGVLRDVTVVDCDDDGLLDLNQLENLDYDGLIVTNTFGGFSMEKFRRFCRDNNKVLIVDSALAFDQPHGENEILSFHHTKPWGAGEGGAVIIQQSLVEQFMSVINFGLTANGSHAWGNNAKMSDIAAAFILQRVRTLPAAYRSQFARVRAAAHALGYGVLGRPVRLDTPAHVPLVAPRPVPATDNPLVKLHKYYRPLAATPRATSLYNRIVNFPCHPEIAAMDDYEIQQALAMIL